MTVVSFYDLSYRDFWQHVLLFIKAIKSVPDSDIIKEFIKELFVFHTVI